MLQANQNLNLNSKEITKGIKVNSHSKLVNSFTFSSKVNETKIYIGIRYNGQIFITDTRFVNSDDRMIKVRAA